MEKILIADQDEINLMVTEMVLREVGYDVSAVSDYDDCVRMLKECQFDLLLLGFESSQSTVFRLLEEIRANPAISWIKVTMMVSSSVRTDISNAYRLGVINFIKKPSLPVNLMSASALFNIRYNVITAETGSAALEIIKSEKPDLLLMDLHMPDVDGFDVMNHLAEQEGGSRIPVIVMTGDEDLDTGAEIFQAGAMDYISKPLVMQIAIHRVRRVIELSHLQNDLKEEVRKKTKELMITNNRLQSLSDQTIFALAGAIDAKHSYTNGHSRRVARYAREIARRMGKTQTEQKEIYSVALLHDVGKIAIPDGIIDKPAKLTDEEYEIIKSHTTKGYEILKTISVMPILYYGARWHHERYDGTGYPDGKKGGEIPEIARIICVADCYDAMSSDRSYRKALPQNFVREEIENGLGTQFDPEIGRIMLEMIDEDPDYTMCGREKPEQ